MDFLKEEQQFYQNKSTNVLTKTDQVWASRVFALIIF